MQVLKEGWDIFRRNPLSSTFTLLLMIGASLGQAVSLSSIYPILQALIADHQSTDGLGQFFIRLLAVIGAAPTLLNLLLLFMALGVSYSILNWSADAFQNIQLKNFESALRRELLEAAVGAKWVYGRDLRHGEFLNVITREAVQYRMMIRHLLYAVSGFLQFAVLLVYAFYLNWEVTGLGIVIFSVGGLVFVPMLRWAAAFGKTGSELGTAVSNNLVAALRSLKMAKALSLEKYLVRTVQPGFEAFAANSCNSNLLSSGQYAVMEIVGIGAISSMLYVGLTVLSVPKAELVVILLLLFRALPLLRIAIDSYHRLYGFLPSMEFTREHLAAARSAAPRHGGAAVPGDWKSIEFRRVGFAYEDRALVSDLSLRFGRGEFWAIAGASGSGKTTLLDLLLGLLEPQAGTIAIDGMSLTEADLESWHAQLAYLGQEAFVFAGTVRDNLLWGSESHWPDAELREALRAAKLETSLDREAGENGVHLSGGEKQRLALARLFLRKPSLVILDEPTTGLDVATERDIFESIASHFRNTTIVMVTHREDLSRGADHVVRFTSEGVNVVAGFSPRSRPTGTNAG